MRTHWIPALLWGLPATQLCAMVVQGSSNPFKTAQIMLPKTPFGVWLGTSVAVSSFQKVETWTRGNMWVLFAATIFLDDFWYEFSDGRHESDQNRPEVTIC